MHLDSGDMAMLAGERGEAAAFSMRIIRRLGEAMGATRLINISSAHVDSCLYLGPASTDFAQRLVDGDGTVAVDTTLNVSSLDLLHPDLYLGDAKVAAEARRLMVLYEQLGARPTWTCAPYQQDQRPSFGEQIAWAESNAIVFANSVLGARSNRYGDFVDIAAAITGRVPAAGLHLDENRRATVLVTLDGLSDAVMDEPDLFALLGFWLGPKLGAAVCAIDGLPDDATEPQLKALGAAGASSGSMALFHAIGITPEAPTRADACGGIEPAVVLAPTTDDLRVERERLTTAAGTELAAVSLGTPHYGVEECGLLVELLDGRRIAPGLEVYVATGRSVLHEVTLRGWAQVLSNAGVTLVTDTCTYVTPIIKRAPGLVLTDSAKWAWYAPGNLGVDVAFATTRECIESAVAGRLLRSSAWEVGA